jgi:hypothetical protein
MEVFCYPLVSLLLATPTLKHLQSNHHEFVKYPACFQGWKSKTWDDPS